MRQIKLLLITFIFSISTINIACELSKYKIFQEKLANTTEQPFFLPVEKATISQAVWREEDKNIIQRIHVEISGADRLGLRRRSDSKPNKNPNAIFQYAPSIPDKRLKSVSLIFNWNTRRDSTYTISPSPGQSKGIGNITKRSQAFGGTPACYNCVGAVFVEYSLFL